MNLHGKIYDQKALIKINDSIFQIEELDTHKYA